LAASLAEAGGRAAAVGECGLDYHHMDGSVEAQRRLFEGQIELAAAGGLPLVVHSREAFADTLAILAAARLSAPVVIHCFGYRLKEAEAFLELGCHVSFAGNFTYKKAADLREALAVVPAARLLLETDAPYMNPEPRRGRPSSPLDIARSYEAAAALRGVSPAELAATVASNVRAVFGPGDFRA
ncbi:MAG: TatD family hydrolase, partial [Spirochaetaceae bacterium]|nr:TatD family hydrolase [Spirochaetaceae bacterium]